MTPILELQGVSSGYGPVRVLHSLATKARDATGKDHAGSASRCTRGLEDMASTIQVHAQRVVEALFTFATDHGGKVEDGGRRRTTDRAEYGVAITDVPLHLHHPRV